MNTGLTIPFTGLKKQYHNLRTETLDAIDEVLRSGQLMNGNHTFEFENWLAKKNRVKFATTCHSGTQALEIIASFYALKEKFPNPPLVLLPTLTYCATANAFIRAGWDVHFIDTNGYGLMDTTQIPHNLSYQAVVLVGLYGASIVHHGEVRMWQDWVHKDQLVIEDAAQHWLSASCRRIGEAAAISFDPMKNLACYGNGGAVLTNNPDLNHYAKSWRDNGKPSHDDIGTNSRMSELDCATMMIKARHIDAWQNRRRSIAHYWVERLENSPVRCLIDDTNEHDHGLHKFVVDLDNRDQVQRDLSVRKIDTRVHYEAPLHEIKTYRQYPGPSLLSIASSLSRRVLSLPFYPELTDLEVEYIIDQVLALASQKRN
jgi:dTDP-4-amino-4,6-dideoxygalactose transaminase